MLSNDFKIHDLDSRLSINMYMYSVDPIRREMRCDDCTATVYDYGPLLVAIRLHIAKQKLTKDIACVSDHGRWLEKICECTFLERKTCVS